MKRLIITAALVLSASAALADPQVPTWANPYPDQPVATDGSPLPRQALHGSWFGDVVSGRSVAAGHHQY